MSRTRSMATLSAVYIGTVIGAGFASGQEIMQFFGKHGKWGILGIIITTLLFAIIGSTILMKVYFKRIKSFEEFSRLYIEGKLFELIHLVVTFLLFVGYFVMLAGSGAIVEEHFEIPAIYGILFMTGICFIVFMFGVNGIARANYFIVPVLILVIIYVSLAVLRNNQFIFSNFDAEVTLVLNKISFVKNYSWFGKVVDISGTWFWSSLLYVSYNCLSAIVVMTSLLPLIHDSKAARLGGTLGGIGLGILALLILLSLLTMYTDIIGLEVPMISVAYSLGDVQKQIYSSVLLMAMFTTAIANGYGCIQRISYLIGIEEKITALLICGVSVPFAKLGFKNLVNFFYPLFGYIGFVFIIMIIFRRK